MSKDTSLKRKNLAFVIAYLFLNGLVFLFVNNLPSDWTSGFDWRDTSKWTSTGIIAISIQLAALILSWLVPHAIKDTLVFWRIRHPLPGCRVFTKYAKKDDRIDIEAIERELKVLPTDPSEQNRTWYKRYFLKVEKDPIILDVHGKYLLFRELSAVAAILTPALAVPTFIISDGFVPWLYLLMLAVLYGCLMWAGRNAGIRFVCTVLARGTQAT